MADLTSIHGSFVGELTNGMGWSRNNVQDDGHYLGNPGKPMVVAGVENCELRTDAQSDGNLASLDLHLSQNRVVAGWAVR